MQRAQQTYASMTVERDGAIGDESEPAYVGTMPIDDEERDHRRRTPGVARIYVMHRHKRMGEDWGDECH